MPISRLHFSKIIHRIRGWPLNRLKRANMREATNCCVGGASRIEEDQTSGGDDDDLPSSKVVGLPGHDHDHHLAHADVVSYNATLSKKENGL